MILPTSGLRFLVKGLLIIESILTPAVAMAAPARHPLTVEDVLETVSLERATISPDQDLIAAVVQRPVSPGEVYGRTAYEVDPSRSDIWLITRQSNSARNLTQGKADAAGYWCAVWSPNGQRLAMLSTKPEGDEPRGGSNVHLYIWDRATGTLRRASPSAISTQTRYGSPLYAVDLQANDGRAEPNPTCRQGDENAPFLWLDDHRLLAVALQPGEVSALFDQYGRPFAHSAETQSKIVKGAEPTPSRLDSVESSGDGAQNPAIDLRLIDLARQSDARITTIRPYPFDGSLAIRLSPDLKRAAILLPQARLAPTGKQLLPNNSSDWHVIKRLGFVSLEPASIVAWLVMPAAAKYPLELLDWSRNGNAVAFQARSSPEASETVYFLADMRPFKVRPIAGELASNLAQHVDKAAPSVAPLNLPRGSMRDRSSNLILWYEQTKTGSTLWETDLTTGSKVERLALNGHLGDVAWGEARIFDYQGPAEPRKAALILPPNFDARKRYPVITWLYPGYVVDNLNDYFLDPYLPGIYNLQLYAAKGFVVLIPSMPRQPSQQGKLADAYLAAVNPAVDSLIQMGIADPDRVAVMGQSFGGYAVYSLLTRTDRFSAAIALAGISDLTQYYYQLDPLVRGYGSLEGNYSANVSILERGSFRFGASPSDQRVLYSDNSPLSEASKVTTPLLMVHGDLDVRGSLTQADTFFSALKHEGKKARLLRYWGESHSLAQSPANVRDIVGEITEWLDSNLGPGKLERSEN
jgi:dipeptidyl aminopeptidase/acylaminoacyl peptidase